MGNYAKLPATFEKTGKKGASCVVIVAASTEAGKDVAERCVRLWRHCRALIERDLPEELRALLERILSGKHFTYVFVSNEPPLRGFALLLFHSYLLCVPLAGRPCARANTFVVNISRHRCVPLGTNRSRIRGGVSHPRKRLATS
jgi:hypothetical protein